MPPRNRLGAPPKSPTEQVRTIRRELLELERGDTEQEVVLRSVRRRLRSIEHQLQPRASRG